MKQHLQTKLRRISSVLGVDRLHVVFESSSNSLYLLYNVGVTHVVTYNNLIVVILQEDPMVCDGNQNGRCSGISG
jgi:hypothetical protein